ncbi:hypothetical protein AX17_000948 [Amanita inopinata Kibby_2008]|nr:hypothetical protein AX17_000948 [Amanita inopinata Kibby_2008]
MSSTHHNSRASLLAGLRTGGVRSASVKVPHSAAPRSSFGLPRFVSQHHQGPVYSEEEDDQLTEMLPQSLYVNANHVNRSVPMTAAADGGNNRFVQAQMGLNPNSIPFSPSPFPNQNMLPQTQLQNQAQALQMQILQLEMMRIQTQALQAQQCQAELIAQAQRQQQQQQQQAQVQAQAQARERRTSLNLNYPSTAGPHVSAFDLRSATLSAQMRRASQAEQLRAQLGLNAPTEEQVPMTATLGGRFGGRPAAATNNLSRFIAEEHEENVAHMPAIPGSTTVISGGTSLSNLTSNHVAPVAPPSRSDQVANWRRGGSNSVLYGNLRAVSSPAVKITPPPAERQRISPPPGIIVTTPIARGRPQPLHIFPDASQSIAAVAIDASVDVAEDDNEATSSSGGSATSARSAPSNISSPTTPRSSASSTNIEPHLSPREEATKKLYEGLGIGRPVISVANSAEQHLFTPNHHQHQKLHQYYVPVSANYRMVSQPTRQPRGPPSGADELGPKNFASRIRRQAIGGLEVLMGARERRGSYVEAY